MDTESDLVFRGGLGSFIHPGWFSREFERLIGKAGVKRIRLHDLRHTYATLALKACMHPKIGSSASGAQPSA